VLSHAADVAITGKPPGDDRLVAEPFMENEIVCITAPDDPIASDRRIEASQLAGRPWLLREPGSGTRTLNDQFLADHSLDPETLTLGSNGAIKQAARAGLGVSLLSRAAVEWELSSGWLDEIPLVDGPETRPWFVLRSAVGPVRLTVELFTTFVREGSPALARR
jgi:DNA-binding transcriptional LysR family regulator